jgi:Transcriptional accessory protein
MSSKFFPLISKTLNISEKQIANTVKLLEDGATIPFISRYRKEATGALDEVQIAAINDSLEKFKELDKRKASILATIEEQGKLTPELKKGLRIHGRAI